MEKITETITDADYPSPTSEMEVLQVRAGEMAAEIERLHSVIDEANAQGPYAYELFKDSPFGMDGTKGVLVRGAPPVVDRWHKPLYARPIPAQQSPVMAIDERTNEFGEPETVYLQLHDSDDGNEKSHGSNYRADGVTWCWHPINENDVRYIRADLVQQSPAVAVPDLNEIADILEAVVDFTKDEDGRTKSILDAEDMCDLLRKLAAKQSPRITEQDAREIIDSYMQVFDALDFEEWLGAEGRALLSKLNDKRLTNKDLERAKQNLDYFDAKIAPSLKA